VERTTMEPALVVEQQVVQLHQRSCSKLKLKLMM